MSKPENEEVKTEEPVKEPNTSDKVEAVFTEPSKPNGTVTKSEKAVEFEKEKSQDEESAKPKEENKVEVESQTSQSGT